MKSTSQHPNEALRHQRLLRGWSQSKLAELLGTSFDQISRWENGKTKPLPFFQEKFCAVFAMNAEQLGFLEPVALSPAEEVSPAASESEGSSHPPASRLQDQKQETLPREAEVESENHPSREPHLPAALSPSCPAFRIWLCGPFAAERRVGEHYQTLSAPEWGGTNYSRLLLKALLCAPGRHARREALLERLWPEADFKQASQYLNSATTKLREALRPNKEQESLLMSESNASVYRLPGQDVLWTDVDAALALLEEAERVGRLTPPALPLLEEAGAYFQRGPFLEEEEGLWLSSYRASIERARVRTRLWLSEAYVQQGRLGHAETVLNVLLEEDPTDEEVICRLMVLLAQQGMTHQALRLYEQTCERFEQEGLELTTSMRNTAEHLRTRVFVSPLLSSREETPIDQKHVPIPPSITRSPNGVLLPDSLSMGSLPTEASLMDCAIWFGIKQAQIITTIVQWKHHVLFCNELQQYLDQEIKMFDHMKPLFDASENYSLSRRQALMSIAMLPVALLRMRQGTHSGLTIDREEFLSRCAAGLTATWHLLKGGEFVTAEEMLLETFPVLVMLSQKPSPYQKTAAQLAAQNCILMSLVSRHGANNLLLDKWYSCEAVSYSERTDNQLLKIATLKHLASTCYYSEQYGEMLFAYDKAWRYIATSHKDEIPALLRARISSGLAYATAKNGDIKQAQNLLSQVDELFPLADPPVDDQTPLYADCGVQSLYLWGGLTYRLLNQAELAEKTFAQVESLSERNFQMPERTRIEIITHQAATAIAQGNMETFCSYFIATMEAITRIRSKKRRQEAISVYQQARQEWPNEKRILLLADLFVPF